MFPNGYFYPKLYLPGPNQVNLPTKKSPLATLEKNKKFMIVANLKSQKGSVNRREAKLRKMLRDFQVMKSLPCEQKIVNLQKKESN